MAIPRMFNTEAPFVVVAGGSGLPSLTKEDVQDREEDKGSLAQAAGPHLSRVTELGTAKHMGAEGPDPCEENLYVSIIAQAEGEGSQEFSPTTTGRSFPRPQLLRRHSLRLRVNNAALGSDTEEDEDPEEATQLPLHRLLRRRQCKKPGRRERRWRRDGDVEEPPIIQGLWVQEIDWLRSTDQDQDPDQDVDLIPPPPQFEDYGDERSVPQPPEGGGPPSGDQNGDRTTGSSRVDRPSGGSDPVFPRGSELDSPTWDPMEVSGFDSSTLDLGSASSWRDGSDSSSSFTEGSDLDESRPLSDPSWSLGPENLPGPCDVPDSALEGLRGKVSQVPRNVVSPFFQKLLKQTVNVQSNEGILLHSRLHPSRSRYREGEEYHVLHHIQNGSYGDVFCIRDSTTGFECAAKRILLSHFSSEEVCTWSALDSPRVVELFGAVIEGPSITLFMDLKPGCLAQLLRQRGSLPQDLALHYLHQVLGALEHLHQRHVLHLDVKVDNVLLSADGRDAFLCDFGLSETSDLDGRSAGSFRGSGFPGTETHMAPEVARGERRCCKSDVWSSCCMLLHMLNGCQPWTRFYTHPLCLKIVSEPPPLWEVPSTCNHFTAEVFRAGLQKEPGRRASARELRRKTTKALRAVGGLSFTAPDRGRENRNRNRSGIRRGDPRSISSSSRSGTPSAPAGPGPAVPRPAMHWVSPWRTRAATEDSSDSEERISDLDSEEETGGGVDSQPKSLRDDWTAHTKDWESGSESEVDIYMGEGDEGSQAKGAPPKTEADYEGDWEEDREEDERESSSSADCFPFALWERFPLLRKGRPGSGRSWGSEPELVLLRGGVPTDTSALSLSPEPRDHPPSCFSGSDASLPEASDKDSDRWSDDVSSGVFSSYSSQTDGHLEWLVSANQQPASHCFQGVDIWIENCQGESLRIRERRRVQVGHVAVGVSEQIPLKAFSLETLDLQRVPAQQEVHESGLWLRCVPAPEHCQRWSWRVNQGQLEIRE